ncbi:gamma-glutamyltransferase family protein [Alkalilimnicola ehrlichii]|uniref:Gamma-glutamyltransferase n=1 Tax=Alkalilimnicola ehrlichii TaxID=351052 RepID=A0A3E0X2M8_9GAMM|nr:gamma-glutamyltransferase family protein [Alkalilimnicola ehrlichii]RFA38504.1 gamma-glutamyltransferase [Alkalilimnicola ehrlichii]
MLITKRALGGMFVAPHHLAAQAGRDVLREGGNAAEAMLAAAAAIAVVYPHMNAIGGDGFWLLSSPGSTPQAIEACGPAAAAASPEFYRGHGHHRIPARGALAALTTAGTIGGWQTALEIGRRWGGRLPLHRLLEDAERHARDGVPVTPSQHRLTAAKLPELSGVPGFAETFLVDGKAPEEGAVLKQSRLADTLKQLAQAGLEDFYRGEIATAMAEDLERLGSPLRREDLAAFRASVVTPLSVRLRNSTVFNQPPPTQGLASLMILGIFDRLGCKQAESFEHLHGLVESTKQAFLVRDRYCTDPAYMVVDPNAFLTPEALSVRANAIDPRRALPWPQPALPGDTVWMGCIDRDGNCASFIQSIYWEFGAGIVLPSTGVLWQNRGISFALDPSALHALRPGRKPFHTLNPALARFDDGRSMVYGTMGGEGQPQTQAAVFSRYGLFNQALQTAVTAPRWLLGRTWGEASTSLKLESRFDPVLVDRLRAAGHEIEVLPEAFSDTMGHAGAVVRHPNGVIEGAADPRSDGSTAAV